MNKPVVSIVIGSYNRRNFLIKTIESVRTNGLNVGYEIIVVDGGSNDGTMEWLLKQKDIITIIQHNRGVFKGKVIERKSWGYFMNLGFKSAQGKFILMLSDDCLVTPNSIANGVNHFENLLASGMRVGAAAFYWRNWPDQVEYNVGLAFGKIFVNHGLYYQPALKAIDWINETDYHFYHADSDLCLKLWLAGYEVVDAPDSYVEHFTHANLAVRNSNLIKQQTDWQTYNEKWKGVQLPGRLYTGDWLFKSFVDTSGTISQFPLLAKWRISLSRRYPFLDKVIKKLSESLTNSQT